MHVQILISVQQRIDNRLGPKQSQFQSEEGKNSCLCSFRSRCGHADIKQKSKNFFIIRLIYSMALTSAQRTGFAICLVLTILLVGLHFAVAASGHIYFKEETNDGAVVVNNINYSNADFNQFAAFLIIAAGLTFFISLVLLIALCAHKFTPKVRHLLATFNLILEFAIAVTVSIEASQASNLRDMLYNQLHRPQNSDLNLYYDLAIADAVITFVLQVVYLVVIYFGTLEQIEHHTTLVPTVVDPPITADRLR